MIAEQQVQQEILKEEALSFDNVAIDNVLGDNGNEAINHRVKLNLLNVMNNKKVDRKVDVPSKEDNNIQENNLVDKYSGNKQVRIQNCDERGSIMKFQPISLVDDTKSTSSIDKLVETKSSFCSRKDSKLFEKNPYSFKPTTKQMSVIKVSKYVNYKKSSLINPIKTPKFVSDKSSNLTMKSLTQKSLDQVENTGSSSCKTHKRNGSARFIQLGK